MQHESVSLSWAWLVLSLFSGRVYCCIHYDQSPASLRAKGQVYGFIYAGIESSFNTIIQFFKVVNSILTKHTYFHMVNICWCLSNSVSTESTTPSPSTFDWHLSTYISWWIDRTIQKERFFLWSLEVRSLSFSDHHHHPLFSPISSTHGSGKSDEYGRGDKRSGCGWTGEKSVQFYDYDDYYCRYWGGGETYCDAR